jgi:hypothetical protein
MSFSNHSQELRGRALLGVPPGRTDDRRRMPDVLEAMRRLDDEPGSRLQAPTPDAADEQLVAMVFLRTRFAGSSYSVAPRPHVWSVATLRGSLMTHVKRHREPIDAERIDIENADDIVYWTETFNVSLHALQSSVSAVGPRPEDVRRHLEQT